MSETTSNVIQLPPRNSKQALIATLRKFLDQAERDEIASVAIVCCRPAEDASDPATSYYQWCTSLALIGASSMLTRFMLDDSAQDLTDQPSWSV